MKLIPTIAAAAALASTAGAACAGDLVIHAGTLIDGVSAAPRHQVSILIRDDRLTIVGS